MGHHKSTAVTQERSIQESPQHPPVFNSDEKWAVLRQGKRLHIPRWYSLLLEKIRQHRSLALRTLCVCSCRKMLVTFAQKKTEKNYFPSHN